VDEDVAGVVEEFQRWICGGSAIRGCGRIMRGEGRAARMVRRSVRDMGRSDIVVMVAVGVEGVVLPPDVVVSKVPVGLASLPQPFNAIQSGNYW